MYAEIEGVECPECGDLVGDLWDFDWGSREEIETVCGECGAIYILQREVRVYYQARPVTRESPNVNGSPACGETEKRRDQVENDEDHDDDSNQPNDRGI